MLGKIENWFSRNTEGLGEATALAFKNAHHAVQLTDLDLLRGAFAAFGAEGETLGRFDAAGSLLADAHADY